MIRTPDSTLKTSTCLAVLLLAAPVILSAADELKSDPAADKAAFGTAAAGEWKQAFSDPCTGDWKQHWFLDGEVGTVTNSPKGMTLTAGPEFKNDAHHMVLWTKASFKGDLKIEYDYTRLDQATNCVTILYLQATGSGEGPYAKDITQWNDLRKVPSMATYFNYLNTYHISYASFMNSATQSYIRGRRYMPHKTGLKGSDLEPDYIVEGLFATGVKHHITVVKKDRALFMRVENPDGVTYCQMHNADLPVITEGRIGLRHMFTRSARYRNFTISVPTPAAGSPEALSSKCPVKTEADVLAGSAEKNPAAFPTPRQDTWLDAHRKREARLQQGNVDVLIVGDSITAGWGKHPALLKKAFEDLQVVNLGHPADKTENILWRLRNHSFDKVHPKIAMVMAGTNNSNHDDYTVEQIAGGVRAIIDELRLKLPQTKILLLGIFPRGSPEQRHELKRGITAAAMNPQWGKIDAVNRILSTFADGRRVVYQNINQAFLNEKGELPAEFMPDLLHPDEKGYEIWSRALQPLLEKMRSPSAEEIAKLRAKIRESRESALASEAGKPLVRDAIIKDWNKRGDFTRKYNQSILAFAERVLVLDEQENMAEANAALREMCQYHLERPQTLLEIHSFPFALSATGKLYLQYGPKGITAPGRMTPETCAVVEDTLWAWATEKAKLADAEVEESRTWWISESENHHANHLGGCFIASKALKDVPRYQDKPFKDGHTAKEHFDALSTYAKEYVRQRACKGMLLEIDSPSYTTATLGFIETVHKFADDPVLKKRAGMFMELYWALVAEEQFDGITGGAMTRCYMKHAVMGSSFLPGLAGYVLGVGEGSGQVPDAGSWEVPEVVLEIAHRWPEQAPYEIRQRRMGLAVPGYDRPSNYRLRTDFGGLLRYTYCAPEFIMGSLMHEPLPTQDWVAISSQNRWSGVIFRGGGRVFPAPYHAKGDSILNGFWSVQSKGTMIAQQLPPRSKGEPIDGEGRAEEWRVFFSKDGLSKPVQDGPWVFAEAKGAYVGVRVLAGETSWEEHKAGQWLVCKNSMTPVVIEVGRKSDHADYDAFRAAAKAQALTFQDGMVRYASLAGDSLVFDAKRTRLPEINGKPVNLAPEKVYDSPFVQSVWNSGVVTIQFGDEKRVLDFSK